MKSSEQKSLIDGLRQTLQDPVLFAERILRHKVWSMQGKILRSVAAHKRTVVKACHASGKTFSAAELVVWWMSHRKNAMVITTAPTFAQVEKVLWPEIRSVVQDSRLDYPVTPTTTAWKLDANHYAVGLSTNEGSRFQGFHGNDVLIIIDEAPGVRPQIFEAIEGIRAGGDVRILMLGNPTIASGPFYDAFTSNRENWNCLSISANLEGLTLESLLQRPDEELDNNPYPHLVTRRWVKEKYFEWGPGHPLWESRVCGNFPAQSEDALLSLTWLEEAKYREGAAAGPFHAGIDVGGPGEDETVLCIKQGQRIVDLRTWSKADPRGEIVAALNQYKSDLETVNIDSVGIGYHVATYLGDCGFPVQEINVGDRANDTEKFANLKAELYWGLRLRAETGDISGLTDERTIAQLAGVRYSHNARGQVEIESKEQARKRGVKSPDRAEAVMLAYAGVVYAEPRILLIGERRLW